ncbi:MAG: tail fiber domain-containing protein [Pseudomonadota bacterium]|nr:tail fiber domain-containing protein [Pseudomonadota bacterium]
MGKSKQKTTTQQTQTVTPRPDPVLQQGVYGLQDMINNLRSTDPTDFVAGPSSLQNSAFSAAGGLANRMMGSTSLPLGMLSGGAVKKPVMDKGPAALPMAPGGTQAGNIAAPTTADRFQVADAGTLASPDPNTMFAGAGLLAANAGMAGPNTVGSVAMSQPGILGPAAGYDASGPAGVERGQAALGAAGALAPIAQGETSGPATAQAVNASGPAAAQAVNASGPAAVERGQASLLGDPSLASLSGYNASTGQAVGVGDLPTMNAAQIEQADIDRFMNPYLSDVVGSTAADLQDQFGRVRAANAANAAGSGAFGSSRYGVREAQTEGEFARALGSTLGGLRADGFNAAADLANQDVGRRQDANAANFNLQGQAALTDAAAQNQFGLANMDALNQAAAFGADARNAGLLANMDAKNDFAARNQAATNQFGLANMDAANRSALDYAGRSDVADQFSADAANRSALDYAGRSDTAGQFSADAANRSALDYVGRSDAMGVANMDARNRAYLDAAGRGDTMTLANMSALNDMSRFNADAANRSALDYAGRSDSAGQFNAGQRNQFGLAQFGADTDANFRNADALNNMSQFNAGQQDAALARMLQSAGLLGDLGATVGSEDRANIGLLAQLGEQQRDIEQDARNAAPTLAQLIAMLQGSQPFGAMAGQHSTGTGTSTTTNSPSALQTLGQAGQAGAILFSDARLKEGIETVGYDDKRRRWVDFSYIGKPERYRGVIAQEIAESDPDAVIEHESGFLQVDYSKLN